MCIKCDGYSDDEVMRGIDLAIRVYGFYIQGVIEDPDGPGNWAYTIGLTDFGLPELVLTDHSFTASMQLLNAVGRRLIAGESMAEAVSDLDCTLGPVHLDHLDRDLIVVWLEYYAEMRAEQLPPTASFFQLIPAASERRSSVDVPLTDLSRSC